MKIPIPITATILLLMGIVLLFLAARYKPGTPGGRLKAWLVGIIVILASAAVLIRYFLGFYS